MKVTRKTDPVCGMDVDPSHAGDETTYGGQTFYFCSARCSQEFEANPKPYLEAHPNASVSHQVDIPSPHVVERGTSGTRQRGLGNARRGPDGGSR